MVVLDTDHMTFFERSTGDEALRLRARLLQVPLEERATTIISFEEQSRGWLAQVSRARTALQQISAYAKLARHLEVYASIRVLRFTEAAAIEYQRHSKLRLHLGTMDLRIAAIVIAHNATLLSRNLADFGRVPELKVEDWTAEVK